MSRYIDAYEVKRQIQKATEGEVDVMKVFLKAMYSIDKIPTADVRENVRGEWITVSFETTDRNGQIFTIGESNKCSVCGHNSDARFNFCPNCGANMRGDKS